MCKHPESKRRAVLLLSTETTRHDLSLYNYCLLTSKDPKHSQFKPILKATVYEGSASYVKQKWWLFDLCCITAMTLRSVGIPQAESTRVGQPVLELEPVEITDEAHRGDSSTLT